MLFVDDEPIVLMGLKRIFHHMAQKWDMLFASGAQEALALMAARPVDAIVTDLTMPGLDGTELLRRTLREHPDAVRVLLSGYSEEELLGRALAPAHQFFAKPCDERRLANALEEAMDARAYVTNSLVLEKIGLPLLPEVLRRIAFELDNDAPDIEEIAALVTADSALAEAVLELVDGTRLCAGRTLETPRQAVLALGIEIVQPAVLFLSLFSRFEAGGVRSYALPKLKAHCLRSAGIARAIALDMGLAGAAVDCAYSAALLHDTGKLLLDVLYASECQEIMEAVRADNRRVSEVEAEHLGLTHAQVGAYLLGLLGLPQPVVRAVARHHAHSPEQKGFHAEDAVYFANVLDHGLFVFNECYARPEPDPLRLAGIGGDERLGRWRKVVLGLGLGHAGVNRAGA
ncbi:HDOD domain-containing protein [Humidesulfovibrio sp.]|uniref:HDOD domain-containing protein n=1 Tax=Humidesulfovibrio sp. TaxID=2910988 RepID=UPI00280A89D7|nr:HDOD domain-containing protein [Humidesulfovibrio sp.]